MNYPQYIFNFISETIFPIKCIDCGKFSALNQRKYICKKCLGGIEIKKKFECPSCETKVLLGETCQTCIHNCSLDQLFTVCDYDNPLVIKIIKTFKYRFIADMAEPLAFLLKKYIYWLNKEKHFNILAENPLILPVPLYYRRLNWRGFNQAELIAKILADNLYTTFESNLLIRASETKPQAEVKEKGNKIKNIGDIFKITDSKKIKGRTILLVDDVCTTGTTLSQCSKSLKQAGAKKVMGFVIARG